jgi:hypothetical protein
MCDTIVTLLAQVSCSSIGALHVDNVDGFVYAGCGVSTSSEQGPNWFVTNSPYWGGGVFFSSDGGASWRQVPGFPEGYGVSDIVSLRSDAGHALLVSSRGNFFTGDGGGIWASLNGSVLKQVFFEPVFDLLVVDTAVHRSQPAVYAALPLTPSSIFVSTDFATWRAASDTPIPWSFGNLPFYLSMDVTRGARPHIVVVGLTVAADNASATFSDMFYADASSSPADLNFKMVANQPVSLDEDSMPKDRAAVMADPAHPDILYVAGNAGAVAWRVDIFRGQWDAMYGNDTADGSCPHCDCRNWAWDKRSNSALLTSDGGVFMRSSPREAGSGAWRGVQGDMTVMEFYTAAWDSRLSRWIAGAQDNCKACTCLLPPFG